MESINQELATKKHLMKGIVAQWDLRPRVLLFLFTLS
jgi:hypothetical protein